MDDKGNPVYMYDFSGYGIEYNDYPDTVYIAVSYTHLDLCIL